MPGPPGYVAATGLWQAEHGWAACFPTKNVFWFACVKAGTLKDAGV